MLAKRKKYERGPDTVAIGLPDGKTYVLNYADTAVSQKLYTSLLRILTRQNLIRSETKTENSGPLPNITCR